MSMKRTLPTSVRVAWSAMRGLSPRSAHPREEPFHVAHHPLQVAAPHHLHHFLHLLELAEQLVHRLHRHPGAGGDTALARGLDELGLRALLRGHRVDDALDAPELLVVLELRGVNLADELRRQLVDERGDPAHLLHLRYLRLEILKIE